MNVKFSKELVSNDSTKRPDNQLRLYKILDDKDQLIGQFFYYPKEQIIKFSDREISIEVFTKFLKKTKSFLIDKKDNRQVGEYEIFGGSGVNHFWQDAPSSPTGIITIGDTTFNFRRIPPNIKYSFLNQDTWSYFKFRLYSIKGTEFYQYSLKMDIPVLRNANYIKYTPFVGIIESNANNIFAILAGLFLMEVEFDYEDTKYNG